MKNISYVEHSDEYDSYYSFADMDDGFGHYNVPGSHWGDRKYQYKDGSLTPLGRIHYGVGKAKEKAQKTAEKAKRSVKTLDKEWTKEMKPIDDMVDKVSDKMANIFSEKRRAENKARKAAEKAQSQQTAAKNKQQLSDEDKKKLEEASRKGGLIGGLAQLRKMNKEKQNKDADLDKLNSKSEYVKTTYDSDKNEYTHTIDISKFLNDANEIDEKKVKEFLSNDMKDPKVASAFKEMYQQDKKNGVMDNLDSEAQKTLEKQFGNGNSNQEYTGGRYGRDFNSMAKAYGYSSGEDLVKQHYPYDADDQAIGERESGRELMKAFGLKTKDLAMDHDEYIVRKDAKSFEFTDKEGKTRYANDFDDAIEAYQNGWKPKNDSLKKSEISSQKEPKSRKERNEQEFSKNVKTTGDDWVTLDDFRSAVPVEDKDVDANVREVMDIFGLNKNDLIVKRNKYGRPESILRKDGKAFEYQDSGYRSSTMDLKYLADEGSWPMNSYFKALNGNGDNRQRNIQRVKSLKNSGLTIEEIAKKMNMPAGTVSNYLYY